MYVYGSYVIFHSLSYLRLYPDSPTPSHIQGQFFFNY